MPTYTTRLNLPKPLGSENVTRALHNELIDAIDAVTATQVGAIPTSDKGAANGVASLDAGGTIPDGQIPATAIRTTQKGVANGVADLDASGNVPASRLGNVPPSNILTMVNAWIG